MSLKFIPQSSKLKINPMASELLQQVRVLDPVSATDRVADVLIENGVIQAVEAAIVPDAETEIQDGRGLILAPGLVDLYSHSGEPGFEERETLASLMASAIAGGFTRLAILPDTLPAIDNPASVAWIHQQKLKIKNLQLKIQIPHLHCWAALTLETHGQQMTELAELAIAEIVGFTDGKPIANLNLLRRILEYAAPLQKPIALFACDPLLMGNGVMREGRAALQFGLSGIPAIAETAALAAILECVAAIGTAVHLMRVSTTRSVALIADAKARGLPITASTTWMHLLLDSQAVASYDPNLRLHPPVGNPDDQAALIQAVKHGVIDAIAVDHTPFTYEEKTVAFAEAPAGAIGLELTLPLLWQQFVTSGEWSALELWQALSTRPALCLHQSPATIAPGQNAEMILFDPNQTWQVEVRSLKSLSNNTPWLGQAMTGQVRQTWIQADKVS